MRKGIRRALLLALLLALLCIGALAADKASADIKDVKDGYSLTANTALDQFTLNYDASSGEQLVMLLKDGATPTENNIYYIDQKSGSGNFTIYPKQLTTGTYYVVVANTEAKTVATIDYKAAGVPVSGTALSWNGTDNATYMLYPGDTTDADIMAEWSTEEFTGTPCDSKGTPTASGKQFAQEFRFDTVAAGSYKLAIFKPGKYVPKVIPISVDGEAVELGEQKLWLYGDVNYDKNVNTTDATQALRYFTKKNPNAFSQGTEQDQADRFVAANVNRDNAINVTDAAQMLRYFTKKPNAINNFK